MSAMTGINDDYKILSLCRQAETGEDQPQATQQEYYFKSIGFHINQFANVAIFSENSAFAFKFCVFYLCKNKTAKILSLFFIIIIIENDSS